MNEVVARRRNLSQRLQGDERGAVDYGLMLLNWPTE